MENSLKEKQGAFEKFLIGVERAGNKIPDVITLFIGLSAAVVVISWILSAAGISVIHPGTGATVYVVNLFSREGVRLMWSYAVTNFSGFPPFGVVLVAVIGAGAAEKSGFLPALMKKLLAGVKPIFVTITIVVVGLIGNIAGDSAFIVLPPIAAAIYLSMGRHPLLGIFTAFAAVAAGFSANVIIGLLDALIFGFTESAARMIDPSYVASPAVNYYFLAVSFFLLAVVAVIVSEKVVAPRFGSVDVTKYGKADDVSLTAEQLKGLRWAGISFLIASAVVIFMSVGGDPVLGEEGTGSILAGNSPFMRGIIVTVALLMFVPSYVYGTVSGRYKNKRELNIFTDVTAAFKDMAGYILLCFFAAQFINYFGWSNLAIILAVRGADVLTALNITGIPLLLGIVFITCVVNLFIGSASAKWALLAPIFVPMMMILGFDPAVTQLAFRIGDSITNPISPLFMYLPLIIGFCQRYEKNTGIGTVIANMIPFSIWFAVVWVIQFVIWVLMDIPLGPGGGIFLIG